MTEPLRKPKPKKDRRFHAPPALRVPVLRYLLLRDRTPRVHFIIMGAQKSGTTVLASYLRPHPQLFVPRPKEVHYFDRGVFPLKGDYHHTLYHTRFAGSEGALRVGEGTPSYMYWYDAPRRIWSYNPAMRLIFILRNPVDRAYSQWNMNRCCGEEQLSFADAVRAEPERAARKRPYQDKRYSYVDRGLYSEQIRRVWRFFPREQTHFILSDELRADPLGTVNRLCAFLDVDPMVELKPRDKRSNPYEAPMGDAERRMLTEYYEPSIRELERMLGWDLSGWTRLS